VPNSKTPSSAEKWECSPWKRRFVCSTRRGCYKAIQSPTSSRPSGASALLQQSKFFECGCAIFRNAVGSLRARTYFLCTKRQKVYSFQPQNMQISRAYSRSCPPTVLTDKWSTIWNNKITRFTLCSFKPLKLNFVVLLLIPYVWKCLTRVFSDCLSLWHDWRTRDVWNRKVISCWFVHVMSIVM